MASYTETAETIECPVIPLRGTVAFPHIPMTLELERKMSVAAFEEAYKNGSYILLLAQHNPLELNLKPDSFASVGTVCLIRQFMKLPNGNVRIVVIGEARADVISLKAPHQKDGVWHSSCVMVRVFSENNTRACALREETLDAVMDYVVLLPNYSKELISELDVVTDNGYLADFIAANMFTDLAAKGKMLEIKDPNERLSYAFKKLIELKEIEEFRKEINKKVHARVDKSQKEYYIQEQLRVLRSELGDDIDSDPESDVGVYKDKIEKSDMPKEAKEKLLKETAKLSKMPINSAEYSVICNYLDVCLELPWETKTKDRVDVAAAQNILNRDHSGLEKVKERILEYLAVRSFNPELGNQIICLVGPPGTGKTSIVRSIAEAMKRNYVRVSLGGVRDEADIRGHRKTYIGSMPGRIIEGIKRAGSRNPVMLLDEIDKLTKDAHGDPASALMEVLDAEQNKAFRDHFVEFPFDLSDVMFIATANNLETIPAPLLDRMEVIELKSYSQNEKLAIAKKYLLPKQLKRHGLTKSKLTVSDGALSAMINGYTREAGVRNLEREIASLCRKVAKAFVEDKELKTVSVTVKNLSKYLGPVKMIPETVSGEDEIGVVNGLAYTESGGTLLKVEAASMPGSGKLELTGSLGDVMKESAKAAMTYIRSHSEEWGIDGQFYNTKDIHIHFPEGAIPKDGPSAGVTMVSALVSELSGRPVKNSVAMTGEVTLRGKVLAIGGLKEKTMAAYKAGVKTVLIPSDNVKDLDDIDTTVRENLEFIPCKTVADVLTNAIVRQ